MTCALTQRDRPAPMPALANVDLDFRPACALVQASSIGKRAARELFDDLDGCAVDPDLLYFALKRIAPSDTPAGILAALRTFARVVQRALQGEQQ